MLSFRIPIPIPYSVFVLSHRDDVTTGQAPPRRGRNLDLLALCALKLAVGLWVLAHGFTHVSDDDYSRTVIAEQFAHVPRLDASGTSWLPVPFWIEGAAMMVFGRTLWVSRAVAVILGTASVAAPYAALRCAGSSRMVTLFAVGTAMLIPWNVWLGVAAVPEGWVGALIAASAIGMREPRARPWAAAGLLVASLSRYEAWPACALMVGLSLFSSRSALGRKREIACALVAACGPLAWMAWNAHAHGSAVHFLARVSAFRRAVGAADVPVSEKLLGYPSALLLETPEVAVLGLVGLAGVAMTARPRLRRGVVNTWERELRARWTWPAVVAAAIGAFLICGDLKDGAPTHHAARALASLWWILVAMGVDAVAALGARLGSTPERRTVALAAAAAATVAWCVRLPARWNAFPGRTDSEQRGAQIARGLAMRERAVASAEITPCSFEHFALIAAWGEPEKASVEKRTGEPPTPECPKVVER